MTNLPSTLQRVLAEFDEKFRLPIDKEYKGRRARMKTFIEKALTESLKEAFAFIEMNELWKVVKEAKDNGNHCALNEKELQADIYWDFERKLTAALQAIEEKRKIYFDEK